MTNIFSLDYESCRQTISNYSILVNILIKIIPNVTNGKRQPTEYVYNYGKLIDQIMVICKKVLQNHRISCAPNNTFTSHAGKYQSDRR